MKQWAPILLALASLITAVAGLVTAVREPKARAGYEEHARTIAAAQEAASANHQDLERLTTFVATQPPPVVVFDPPAASSGGMHLTPRPTATATARPPTLHPLPPPAPPRAFDTL